MVAPRNRCFVHIRGTTMQVEKKLAFLLFASFGLKILPQLNIIKY